MSPELQKSLRERIVAGVRFEEIETELLAAGYSKETAAAAYAEVAHSAPEAKIRDLSSSTTLFKNGLDFAQSRLDWVFILGVASAIFNLVILHSEIIESVSYIIGASIVGFIALFLYAFGLVAVYYTATKAPTEKISTTEGFRWAAQHILSLWWVFLLTFLLIWGGFMLFIIPGILLLFLLYFSQFAYIHEGDRGLDALLRSRALVVGRLGAVAKRLLVLFFYVISISFLVSLPYAVFFGFVGNEVLWIEVVFELVVQLVTAVLTLASIAVGNQLFLELRSDRPRTAPAASVLLRYRLLAIFGSLAAIIMLAVMIIFGFFAWLGYGFIDELPIEDQTEAVRDEVIFTELIAEEYRVQNGTFEGVCERLLPAVVLADTVECNDSETAWALAAQSTDDVWCTDAAGYGKVIAGSIGERTACLNLPEPLSNEEASVGTTTTPVEDMSEIIPVL